MSNLIGAGKKRFSCVEIIAGVETSVEFSDGKCNLTVFNQAGLTSEQRREWRKAALAYVEKMAAN